jgi:hypothetical protein
VLYLEGATDLAILRAFADKLEHPAHALLEQPFVHYVANQHGRARDHFYGLREAKPDLAGVALYDRLEQRLNDDPNLVQLMWRRREIESYLAQREVLRAYARTLGEQQGGELLAAAAAAKHMDAAVDEVASALRTLGRPDPFGPDCKVSDELLDPVFRKFFEKMGLPEGTMRKTGFHALAPFLDAAAIDDEVREKLDRVVEVAARASPVGGGGQG